MKVSIDGIREKLSRDIDQLRLEIKGLIEEDAIHEPFVEDLVNAINEVITDSNVLNCVFSDEFEDDFSDLSDVEIDLIKVE